MQFVGSMRCVWFAIPKMPAHIERIETTTSIYFGNSVLNTMPKNPKKKSRGISALLFVAQIRGDASRLWFSASLRGLAARFRLAAIVGDLPPIASSCC